MNTPMVTSPEESFDMMLIKLNMTRDDWNYYRNVTSELNMLDTPWPSGGAPMCGEGVLSIRNSYRPVHGYLSLLICVFGSISNMINIAVLTRKDMLSPTNAILTGLAIADLAVMLDYIPFSTIHYIAPDDFKFSYMSAVYVLFHAHFAQIFHTISIWMTVMLALWRYLIVVKPSKAIGTCNMHRTLIVILAGFLISPLLCVPSFLVFTIHRKPETANFYRIDVSALARTHDNFLRRLNFWMYSVLIKLGPCVALSVFTIRLIMVLMETNRRKQRLRNEACLLNSDRNKPMDTRQSDRTTGMLVAVLLLFLITEIPQGVLALLSGIISRGFFRSCYHNLGEVIDILALINSTINFPLYCLMSKQFRTTFKAMCCKTEPSPREDHRHLSHPTVHAHGSKITETALV